MLNKKIRKNLLIIASILPSDEDWEKSYKNGKISFSKNLFYNVFDNEWVKNYVYSKLLFELRFIKAYKIKKFIESNTEEYNLVLRDMQKKAIKFQAENLIGLEKFYNMDNNATIYFNSLKEQLLSSFKIKESKLNFFTKMALEVFEENYLDKTTANDASKQKSEKKENGEYGENYNQQNFNELKHEIMPNTLMIVPKLYGETFDFQDDNIVYHLADRQWLNEYFFNKAAQTQMCQNGNLAEVFLNSKEFNAQIKRYQNQLVNYAINTSSITPTGIVTINKNLPLEQSQAILKEQTITSLANNFKMDLSLVNEKELDKKIEKICTSYYEGTLQIQPYTNEIIESDQDDFSPLWPSK